MSSMKFQLKSRLINFYSLVMIHNIHESHSINLYDNVSSLALGDEKSWAPATAVEARFEAQWAALTPFDALTTEPPQ